MKKIAIFASGSGTNAENIINYFKNNNEIYVTNILTNNKNAYVIQRAKKFSVDYFVFSRKQLNETDKVLKYLEDNDIDFIVLAGFLLLMPKNIINKYENKIINIHPALLPKYGGKGMYGDNVHKAVINNSENKSGITIHYVNEQYDRGDIIFQTECPIYQSDTPESLAIKIHQLEHKFFPVIIDKIIKTH